MKAHLGLSFFTCTSCLISLYRFSPLLSSPQSCQVQRLVLTAPPGPTKAMTPRPPIAGGCSSSQSASDTQLRATTSLPVSCIRTLLMLLVWVTLKAEESVCILVWIQLYHLLGKCLYILNQRSVPQALCVKVSISDRRGLWTTSHWSAALFQTLLHRIKKEFVMPFYCLC